MMNELVTGYMSSPLGTIRLKFSGKGLFSLIFTDDPVNEFLPSKEMESCAGQLKEYFGGTLKAFDLKLDLQGTPFRKSVWIELLKIKFGQTISYSALSRKVGDIKAIRAVANANAKNPISIVVPCHRVIGSDGSLTGYAGGLWRKKWLLEHEGKYDQPGLF